MTVPEAKHRLDELRSSILSRRVLHTIDDVIDTVKGALRTDQWLLALFRQEKLFPRRREDSEGSQLYFNFISFLVSRGRVRRFKTPEEATARRDSLLARGEAAKLTAENVEIYASPTCEKKFVVDVFFLLRTFYMTSDAFDHFLEGASYRMLRSLRPDGLVVLDLPSIVELIRKQFGIDCLYYAVRRDATFLKGAIGRSDRRLSPRGTTRHYKLTAQLISQNTRTTSKSSSLIAEVNGALSSLRDYSGRLQSGRNKHYYKILPMSFPIYPMGASVITPPADGSVDSPAAAVVEKISTYSNVHRLGALVLLSKEKRIDRLTFNFARMLAFEYSGPKYASEQFRAIEELSEFKNHVISALVRRPFYSSAELDTALKQYAHRIVQKAISLTAAHSATVRLYNPFRNTLACIAAGYSASLPPSSQFATDIALHRPNHSVNACTFRNLGSGDYAYLPQLDALPERLVAAGLREAKLTRQESRSELCIPIAKLGIPVGTINLEAPLEQAFDRDLPFSLALANAFGDYYSAIMRQSDAAWLPKLSFSHYVAHRLEKIERDRPELAADFAWVRKRISPDYVELQQPSPDHVTVRAFVEQMNRRFVEFDKYVPPSKGNLIKIIGPAETLLALDTAHSLEVVLDAIVENACDHAKVLLDTFTVEVRDIPSAANQGQSTSCLQIKYEAKKTRARLATLDRLGMSPIWSDLDRSYHFGMFLVGVHTRLVGGHIYIDRAPSSADTTTRLVRYVLQVPISTARST